MNRSIKVNGMVYSGSNSSVNISLASGQYGITMVLTYSMGNNAQHISKNMTATIYGEFTVKDQNVAINIVLQGTPGNSVFLYYNGVHGTFGENHNLNNITVNVSGSPQYRFFDRIINSQGGEPSIVA